MQIRSMLFLEYWVGLLLMFFAAAVDGHSLDTQILFIYVFFLSVSLFFGISLTQITKREVKMLAKSVFGTGFCKF